MEDYRDMHGYTHTEKHCTYLLLTAQLHWTAAGGAEALQASQTFTSLPRLQVGTENRLLFPLCFSTCYYDAEESQISNNNWLKEGTEDSPHLICLLVN